jgi:galactokinase
VNLIGEHTDYNDGFVLPMAIEGRTAIAARTTEDRTVWLYSVTRGETASFDIEPDMKPGEPAWANYIKGVVAGFLRRGARIPGFQAVIDSDVPLGSGLSSSAALEVATATLLEGISATSMDPVEKALLCQKAEHDFAGVPCGIMDQFISALGREGHLLLLDCRTHDTEFVPMSDPSVALLIINTNVKHELSGGEYAARRAQCEHAAATLGATSLRDVTAAHLETHKDRLSEVVYRRARHVIGEIDRTIEAGHRIRASHWERLGELMYASHRSLRDDYGVSCAELDAVVSIAEQIGVNGGVYGCRMTGAGFGGCCVALVNAATVNPVSWDLADAYHTRTGIAATMFSSRPAAGATLVTADDTH